MVFVDKPIYSTILQKTGTLSGAIRSADQYGLDTVKTVKKAKDNNRKRSKCEMSQNSTMCSNYVNRNVIKTKVLCADKEKIL